MGRRAFLASLVGGAVSASGCTTDVVVDLGAERDYAFGFRNGENLGDVPVAAAVPEVEAPPTLADAFRPLSPLEPGAMPEPRSVVRPIALRAPSIEIDTATVIDVGVDDAGFLEIPAAREVGWYKFGPAPGETGSSVLAAHIAFNGRDGIFRNIPDLRVGDQVTVDYEDATARSFEILGIVQYAKDRLPLDDIFERRGKARLVLITCGGDFNPNLNSYQDNIIAYAVPVTTV